jgi:ParB/RepB/Spo0J family partition protein
MVRRKKNVKDLGVGFSEMDSIDDLLNSDSKNALSYTSPLNGKEISLCVHKFSGEDILSKTQVHEKNKRIQDYLTPVSLSRMVKSLLKNNQVSPALGRIESDGSITIIFGSRRRMGAYYAGTEYIVLASKDLTDDIAEEISDAENLSETISLIERGHVWLEIQKKEGLSSRDISKQIEDSKVSHTVIASGIAGAKLPLEVIKLYPSTNSIGRSTISKLSASCEKQSTAKIIDFVTDKLAEVTTNLWDAYENDNFQDIESLTTELTNKIHSYCCPKVKSTKKKAMKTNKKLTKGVNALVNKAGVTEYIVFEDDAPADKVAKVLEFINNL